MRTGSPLIWRLGATGLLCLLVLAACTAAGRKKVLNTLFDGVPEPGATEGRAAEPPPRPAADPYNDPYISSPTASAPPVEEGWIPPVIPATRALPDRASDAVPPLEEALTWQQALNLLPTDPVGAVDWIAAIDDGLLKPQLLPSGNLPTRPPFSVGDLVELGAAYPESAFLDLEVEIRSADTAAAFAARFPHSSHTLLLACSSCHPGVVAERTTMDGILDGAYCGKCHGAVAFEPEVGCARCHETLAPPSAEKVAIEVAQARTEPLPATPDRVARGERLYAENCAVCHGTEGDGGGRLAAHVETKPRDFTSGKFKFRSTIASAPPTDVDLFRTITRGVPGTSMPAWSALPTDDRWALVHYIKTFSDRFEREEPGESITIPERPEFTAELLAAGAELYTGAGCHNCHGIDGRGGGPSADGLTDDWGNPIAVFDLASGREPKNGGEPEDFYRLILSGLPGTPMPGFGLALQPEQTWSIVAYVLSLQEGDRQPLAVKGDIPFVRKPLTATLPPSNAAGDAVATIASATVDQAELVPEFTEEEMPPAVFPHWFHRIRFKCSSCHPDTFEMEAGANPITMDSLRRGEFCSTCHNGTIAWQVGFESCVRCHAQPELAAADAR